MQALASPLPQACKQALASDKPPFLHACITPSGIQASIPPSSHGSTVQQEQQQQQPPPPPPPPPPPQQQQQQEQQPLPQAVQMPLWGEPIHAVARDLSPAASTHESLFAEAHEGRNNASKQDDGMSISKGSRPTSARHSIRSAQDMGPNRL
eukprot:scaffold274522_cov14-Tisochrysis_lutea.AAC.1